MRTILQTKVLPVETVPVPPFSFWRGRWEPWNWCGGGVWMSHKNFYFTTTKFTISTMPAVTPLKLEHQLSSMSMTTSTTTKDAPSTPDTALITPTKSEAGGDLSFDTHEDSSQEEEAETPPSSVIQVYQKTDHKLLEEQGKFADEPLLKENPQRFVIFPIQDNDVSLKRLCIALHCIALCGVPAPVTVLVVVA
jgi:hypothetical protein